MSEQRRISTYLENSNEEEDWTFASEDTQYMTHGLHSYPARMMPLIAKTLIQMYSKGNNDVCIDPYCGSGTVLVEAKLKGIKSIGVDANPLAVLLAKVKTTPLEHEVLNDTSSKLLLNIINESKTTKKVELPRIRNLDFWFKPEVSRLLAIIKSSIERIEDEHVQDFFKVCFSITARKVSNNRPGEFKLYRRAKEDLEKFNPDVLKIFSKIVGLNIQKMDSFYNSIEKDAPSTVVKGDTRNLLNLGNGEIHEGCANLLVTSPPYGDSHTTVAYGQFSRYMSLWLGFDEKEVMNVDKIGLGGKVYRDVKDLGSPLLDSIVKEISSRDDFRGQETYAFYRDIDICFEQISKVMKKGESHICYVVGNRTVKRIRIPADKILIELGEKYGFKHIRTIERGIPNKTMPAVNSPENLSNMLGETMSKENIIIWKY